MSKSIPISPKHGVNPTIPICFWCGQEKNEIALLGRLKGDAEAPRHVVIDYEPCDKCKALFNQGIHVIGVTNQPVVPEMFPIVDDGQEKLYPTGSMFVARPEWAERFLTANDKQDMIPNVLKQKTLLLPDDLVNDIVKESKAPTMEVNLPEEETEEELNNENN